MWLTLQKHYSLIFCVSQLERKKAMQKCVPLIKQKVINGFRFYVFFHSKYLAIFFYQLVNSQKTWISISFVKSHSTYNGCSEIVNIKKKFIYLSRLCQVLVVACRLLSCSMHAGSSSLTRDQTWAPCIGSTESYPLDHQGSPSEIVNIIDWLIPVQTPV